MPLNLRSERRAQIAAAVVSGLTTEQAAIKFNVSRSLVYLALRESGLALTSSATKALRSAILQLAARGNPVEAIARRLGVPTQRVRALCKRHGVKLLTAADRVEAARVQARRNSLGQGADLRTLLDGRHVRVLKVLRDTELTLSEIGKRFKLSTRSVFDIWTQALHRLAVPRGSSHDHVVKARRRVLSSGLSINSLCRGHRVKLVRRMRDSDLTMVQLAQNARTSRQTVWRLWYLALDRAAIAATRTGPLSPRRQRKRRTARARRLLRDLVL